MKDQVIGAPRSLGRDIAIVLAVKLIGLLALYYAFAASRPSAADAPSHIFPVEQTR